MLMLKFEAGSLPLPRLWNGPPKLTVIGVRSVLEPDGLTVRLKLRLPLLTACVPLKVWLSSDLASGAAAAAAGDEREHSGAGEEREQRAMKIPGHGWRVHRCESSIGTGE